MFGPGSAVRVGAVEGSDSGSSLGVGDAVAVGDGLAGVARWGEVGVGTGGIRHPQSFSSGRAVGDLVAGVTVAEATVAGPVGEGSEPAARPAATVAAARSRRGPGPIPATPPRSAGPVVVMAGAAGAATVVFAAGVAKRRVAATCAPPAPATASRPNVATATIRRGGRASVVRGAGTSIREPGKVLIPVEVTSSPGTADTGGSRRRPRSYPIERHAPAISPRTRCHRLINWSPHWSGTLYE
ncbi:hypothetical protein Acsp01_22130 [Actinoplanes sp. NBRC 101535]|nr:hypothetical protein Acsp01_22130 [Actinoplanes sp. NBRC 101535]